MTAARQADLFDGATYDPAQDGARLGRQLSAVKGLMKDGHWRSLAEISDAVNGSEAGVSARMRDLRKAKFGGHTILRRRRARGLWEYRMGGSHP